MDFWHYGGETAGFSSGFITFAEASLSDVQMLSVVQQLLAEK